MYRLLITYSNSFAGGGAVCTTTLVPYETRAQADTAYEQIRCTMHYSVLRLDEVEE